MVFLFLKESMNENDFSCSFTTFWSVYTPWWQGPGFIQ